MFSVVYLLHSKASSKPCRDCWIPFSLCQSSLQFKYSLYGLSSSVKHSCLRLWVKKEREESEIQATIGLTQECRLGEATVNLRAWRLWECAVHRRKDSTAHEHRVCPCVCAVMLTLLAFDSLQSSRGSFWPRSLVLVRACKGPYWVSNYDPQLLLATVS